jgi:hypothetical protein
VLQLHLGSILWISLGRKLRVKKIQSRAK